MNERGQDNDAVSVKSCPLVLLVGDYCPDMAGDAQEGALGVHCFDEGEAVAHGDSGSQSGGIGVKIRRYCSTDGSHRDTALACHVDDTARTLAHQRLGIETPFARDDKIGALEGIGKAVALKDIRAI